MTKLMAKRKTKAEDLWRYRTEHIDVMLYQYAVALQEISIVTPVDIEMLNYLVKQRFEFLNKTYKVAPSFTVSFTVESGKIAIVKTPLQ